MSNKKVADLRQDYQLDSLEINKVHNDPIQQFDDWFKTALDSNTPEPNAMILATADTKGRPSGRVVLLKGYDERGFVFYTNYESRKGKELLENPFAALVFNWLELQRQIRINGTVTKLDESKALAYFQSRPKGSQIGAWASPQSQVIENRLVLENNVAELIKEYENQEALPKPEHWGGFLVKPESIEFWQGRSSRLHDRLRYQQVEGLWKIERLAP